MEILDGMQLHLVTVVNVPVSFFQVITVCLDNRNDLR